MSNTISFQCHIQISSKELKKVVGKALTFMGNSKTIDENGKVVFDCELQAQDKAKSFPITIEDEEYVIVGTGKCNAIAHRDSTNPFCLMLNKDNEASIEYIRIYKEIDKADSDQKEQRDIYTAQVEKPNETTQQSNTNDTHNSQAKPQENQNLVNIEVHLTSGKALKKDIQWGYYIKQSNENLKAKVSIKDLKSFTFVSKDTYNTKVSFDINAKFSYTITENNSQKEVEDYLKEKQQLVIFAYKNNPAYNVGERITHTILTISQYPILKLTNKALTILYAHTNATYTLTHSCDTHYLSENLKNERIYTLELRDSNLYIKDKESNKDIALMLTREIPSIQEKVILLDSKDLQNLQTTLGLHTHKDRVEIYVEVQRAKRPNFESVKRAYDEINRIDTQATYIILFNTKKQEAIKDGKSEQEAINIAKEFAEKMQYAQARYEKIGGNIFDEFKRNMEGFRNTCALQVSYALNFGGMSINTKIENREYGSLRGAETEKQAHLYIVGVIQMRDFLLKQWGKPNMRKSFYEISSYKALLEHNQSLLTELKTLNTKGIATIGGQGFINGQHYRNFWHTTLWNLDEFVDVQNERNINYLGGVDNNGVEYLAREFFFWELD